MCARVCVLTCEMEVLLMTPLLSDRPQGPPSEGVGEWSLVAPRDIDCGAFVCVCV